MWGAVGLGLSWGIGVWGHWDAKDWALKDDGEKVQVTGAGETNGSWGQGAMDVGYGTMQGKAFPTAAVIGSYGGSMAKKGWSPWPLRPPCGTVPEMWREGAAVGAELP